MNVAAITSIAPPTLPAFASEVLGQLTRLVMPPSAAPVLAESPAQGETTLTPDMLRAALLEIGAQVTDDTLALAEALTRFGLPLTVRALIEAHQTLSRAPDATPLAYALAKSLALPTTPPALNALTTVLNGIPAGRALPPELTDWLSLTLNGEMEPEALAAHLHLLISQYGQSTEHRLLNTTPSETVHDARIMLLRLTQAGDRTIRLGSDALAAHIEGQQLLNGAAIHAQGHDALLYFALPLQMAGEQTMAELQIRRGGGDSDAADDDEMDTIQTTIRVATTRLGRIQADLRGMPDGRLTCRLGSETPLAARLLQRHGGTLAQSLAESGWRVCDVVCETRGDWPPLWHGGETGAAPRTRVDWRA